MSVCKTIYRRCATKPRDEAFASELNSADPAMPITLVDKAMRYRGNALIGRYTAEYKTHGVAHANKWLGETLAAIAKHAAADDNAARKLSPDFDPWDH